MWKWEASNPKGVIVIVHGAAEHHGRYKWLIEMWRCEGFHVLMGDLPGHGKTPKGKQGHIVHFDEYIEVVQTWYNEAICYNLPIILLGHSMGGLTIIRSLQEKRFQVNGIILSSPWLGISEKTAPSPILDASSKIINLVYPSLRLNTGLTPDMATRNKEVIEFSNADSLYVKKVSVRWFREMIKGHDQAFKDIKKLPDVPLLFMQGGEDRVVNKLKGKDWFDLLPLTNKTYKEWPNLYHEIFNEPEREVVFDFTKRWIENQFATHLQ
jgi:lysophospholipase